jgi:hypothetical protein
MELLISGACLNPAQADNLQQIRRHEMVERRKGQRYDIVADERRIPHRRILQRIGVDKLHATGFLSQ